MNCWGSSCIACGDGRGNGGCFWPPNADETSHRQHRDREIVRKRGTPEVLELHTEFVGQDVFAVPLLPIAAGQLVAFIPVFERCSARDSWAHEEEPPLLIRVARYIARIFRPRTHQAHVAADHVDELRELVQFRSSKPAPDACDAAVPAQGQGWAVRRRIRAHRPELEHSKCPAVASRPSANVKDAACRGDSEGRRDQHAHRRENNQPPSGENEIHATLHDDGRRNRSMTSTTAPITSATSSTLKLVLSGNETSRSDSR